MTDHLRFNFHAQARGLYFLMEALLKGKNSVHLSNECLRKLTGRQRIHPDHIRWLAAFFAPFLGKYEIHGRSGVARTATFRLPGATDSKDSLMVSDVPSLREMEKTLRLKFMKIETKTKSETIVKKAHSPK